MKLQTSADWDLIYRELMGYCLVRGSEGALSWDKESWMLVHNLSVMVSNISKQEVEARRSKQDRKLKEMIVNFNNSLEEIEQLLLINLMSRKTHA